MKIDIKKLAVHIAVPVGVGIISSLASGGTEIYSEIVRPPLSPPSFLFPVVWTILYILMGICAYIAEEASDEKGRSEILLPYYVQLAVNGLWSVIFFRFRLFGAAALWLMMLIVWIITVINGFSQVSKKAAVLMLPYLIWCGFALYLNIGIYFLNR